MAGGCRDGKEIYFEVNSINKHCVSLFGRLLSGRQAESATPQCSPIIFASGVTSRKFKICKIHNGFCLPPSLCTGLGWPCSCLSCGICHTGIGPDSVNLGRFPAAFCWLAAASPLYRPWGLNILFPAVIANHGPCFVICSLCCIS